MPHPTSHTVIIATTASYFGVTVERLLAKDQRQPIATHRKIAMYLCRELLYASYPTIGKWFNRDHTTVMPAIKSIERSIGRVGGATTRFHIDQITALLPLIDERAHTVSVGDGIVLA